MTGAEPVPPIGSQISRLAALAPDEPAVTCDGLTLTRAELDRSTNRLARAYAERGVEIGDYVTIVLPNMAAAFTPMVYAVPVQLLAYHTAVIMGTDVDQPRNLAKSVTVE